MAVTKLRILDTTFRAVGNRVEGYENPNQAHIAHTRNIPANEYKVYFDNFVKGDNVSSEKVEISTRNKGRK